MKVKKTITRNYRNVAQIIYTQNDSNIFDTACGVWTSGSNAKFIYSPYSGSSAVVADALPISNSFRITDMEILDDTLYFCGYQFTPYNAFTNEREKTDGIIGYFDIPRLFNGTDDFHILKFGNQVTSTDYEDSNNTDYDLDDRTPFSLNQPQKIEVFRADSGIHIVCVGLWGQNHQTLSDHFVADIVHHHQSNLWWYYVSLGNSIEAFSDIAVTDHYVTSIAPKNGFASLYSRLYVKPNCVSLHPCGTNIVQMFFKRPSAIQRPIHEHFFEWTSSEKNCEHPRITHTHGDTIAVTALVSSDIDNTIGTVVALASIDDMLKSIQWKGYPYSNPVNHIDNTPSVEPLIDSDYDHAPIMPFTTAVPITHTTITPVPPSIPLLYCRMVMHDYLSETPPRLNYKLPEVRFNRKNNTILVAEANQYKDPANRDTVIYEFNIADSNARIRKYYHSDYALTSIDTLAAAGEICFSGDNHPQYKLTAGKGRLNKIPCLMSEDLIPSVTKWDINKSTSFFSNMRVDPIRTDGTNTYHAFLETRRTPTIRTTPKKHYCQ